MQDPLINPEAIKHREEVSVLGKAHLPTALVDLL
jgi:hypothetical protein